MDGRDKHNFAFVGGMRKPEPIQSRRCDNPHAEVLDAVAILLDWRKRISFRCTADVQFGDEDEVHAFEVTAHPTFLSYSVVSSGTGSVHSYDGKTGLLHEGAQERPLRPNELSSEPLAVRLAFPLSLGIWGRPSDGYRITGAVGDDEKVTLTLEHQQDITLIGELVIDRSRRMAIRLDTPTLAIRYRDIRPITESD